MAFSDLIPHSQLVQTRDVRHFTTFRSTESHSNPDSPRKQISWQLTKRFQSRVVRIHPHLQTLDLSNLHLLVPTLLEIQIHQIQRLDEFPTFQGSNGEEFEISIVSFDGDFSVQLTRDDGVDGATCKEEGDDLDRSRFRTSRFGTRIEEFGKRSFVSYSIEFDPTNRDESKIISFIDQRIRLNPA